MRTTLRHLVTAAAIVLLAGCASRERVILLAGENADPGAVEIRTGGDVMVLSEPLTEASVDPLGNISSKRADEADVQRDFEAALAAMPAPPRSFLLYFKEGTTQLMPHSAPAMEALVSDIERHPVADIQVIGHTDRVGSEQDNDQLARSRADFVRGILLEKGLADRYIFAVGRGEREPLITTEDGIEEPRNRRVQVLVR